MTSLTPLRSALWSAKHLPSVQIDDRSLYKNGDAKISWSQTAMQ